MLKVEQISTGYERKQVLFDISFEIKEGEVVLLTGGNGSGKSTLLKSIYNLVPIWSGSVWFDNEKISALKPSDLIERGIVYIPQKDFCFENLTILENLKIAGNIYSSVEFDKRLALIEKKIDLKHIEKLKPFNLSGGERKLLAFAMGIINHPKLVLLDEPYSGVDVKNLISILNLVDDIFIKPAVGTLIVEQNYQSRDTFSKKLILETGTLKS